MNKSLPALILFLLAIFSLSAGLIGLTQLSHQFSNQQLITFHDLPGDTLLGIYLPGTADIGFLMLEGFGSDQIAMRPAARIMQQANAHIFTFDFSGHGRSSGALGFDNAATDRLAKQVLAAKETFKSVSGLTDDQIIYLGHSLGARVALQSAVLDPSPPAALVLLGTQVNLGTNVQSEFFTGTSDTELSWVQSLSATVPTSQVFLFSGTWDDILTPTAAQALFTKLGGEPAPNRQLTLIPKGLHNYEIYSARLFKEVALSLEQLGWISFPESPSLSGVYLFGALTLIGLFVSLILAPHFLQNRFPSPPPPPLPVTIGRLQKFLWAKLYLWVAALPVAAILSSVFFLLPLHLPVFNLIYVGFIGGYGILMFGLYLWGKVPGTRGKWHLRDKSTQPRLSLKEPRFWLGLLFLAEVFVVCIIFTRSGLFYVIAPNQRLLWVIIFTPVTALGFWVGGKESQMLEVFRHQSGRKLPWAPTALVLIGLTPFFIYTLFMGILGSLSGVVGGAQGLLILAIVLLTGKCLRYFIQSPILVAVFQAALLYTLILPQGVLFAF